MKKWKSFELKIDFCFVCKKNQSFKIKVIAEITITIIIKSIIL